MALNLYHKNLPKVETLHQVKFLHTTVSRRGLEEFFDDPGNWGEKSVKSGEFYVAFLVVIFELKYDLFFFCIIGSIYECSLYT